jgi:hypothetical protein
LPLQAFSRSTNYFSGSPGIAVIMGELGGAGRDWNGEVVFFGGEKDIIAL